MSEETQTERVPGPTTVTIDLTETCLHCVLAAAGKAWFKAQAVPASFEWAVEKHVELLCDLLSVVEDNELRAELVENVLRDIPQSMAHAMTIRSQSAGKAGSVH